MLWPRHSRLPRRGPFRGTRDVGNACRYLPSLHEDLEKYIREGARAKCPLTPNELVSLFGGRVSTSASWAVRTQARRSFVFGAKSFHEDRQTDDGGREVKASRGTKSRRRYILHAWADDFRRGSHIRDLSWPA